MQFPYPGGVSKGVFMPAWRGPVYRVFYISLVLKCEFVKISLAGHSGLVKSLTLRCPLT